MTQFFNDDGSVTLTQGDSVSASFQLMQDSDTPFDLTGYVVEMKIGKRLGKLAFLTMNTGNGKLTIPDPTNGTVHLQLVADDTVNRVPANYFYTISLSNGVNYDETIISKSFNLLGELH